MTINFTNESDFDTLAFANSIQDILSNEDFQCKITELTSGEYTGYLELDLTITLENKTLHINNCFRSSQTYSTRKVWADKNDEQFSCASTFWRYVASNAKEIKE
jgi:hypothetical protein